MNFVGRKIYYEKATGNIIFEIKERVGSVTETTMEQDFESFVILAQRTAESVGCIQLQYGDYADKFEMYYYSIDTSTEQIVWGEKINPEVPDPQPSIEDQIKELKQQNLVLMDALATVYEELLTLKGGAV